MPAKSEIAARRVLEDMVQDAAVLARFGADGLKPARIRDVVGNLPVYADRRFVASGTIDEFLSALPLMTKAELRRFFPHGFLRPSVNFASLVASKKVEVVRTSGTSSDRLQVLWDADWWERQEMAALKAHPAMGPHLNESYREAVLTTPLCSESVCKTGPATLEERRVDHLLFLNTQHDPSRWNTADFSRMAEELSVFKPAALEADPVYLGALVRRLRQNGRPAAPLKWILLTYEFVSALDKETIRSYFGCPIFEFYGLTEAGVFFLECPEGRQHFCGSDCIVEILRPMDSPLPDSAGEVVVTSWGNTAEPLLRYRTADMVTVSHDPCACGAPGPTILSFDGRIRDILELPNGRVFTPRQIDRELSGIRGLSQYICVQGRPASVRVDYVADASADPGGDIRLRLMSIWPGIDITARKVPFISPEPSGKYRTVTPL